MKQTTRDNLIYLAVGLGAAAAVVADLIYSEHSGHKMWWPSGFEFHLVSYMVLLAYFVVQEVRKIGATLAQVLCCVLGGSALHVGIALTFRSTYSGPLNFWLFGLALLEFFAIVELARQLVKYLHERDAAR